MTTPSASAPLPIRTTLIDIANCIGCRACQVACKQWNDREGEDTELQAHMGFQNPPRSSAKTYTLISFHEMENPEKPGGLDAAYVMRRCLHCLEPGCVSACPTTALYRQPDGPVSYDASKCIGCRYCMLACPWDVPTAEWDTLAPKIEKCTHCADRTSQPVPIAFNGQPAPPDETKRFLETIETPACVKACPADALRYGTREEMLALAHKRIEDRPDKYVDHIYGEKEAGRHERAVPLVGAFREARVPDVRGEAVSEVHGGGPRGRASRRHGDRRGARRRLRLLQQARAAVATAGPLLPTDHGHHVEFEPLRAEAADPVQLDPPARSWRSAACRWWRASPSASAAARASPTPIPGACGSPSTWSGSPWRRERSRWPGAIYVFQRKDLYPLGRSAVLMGLLSYSFVMVTLVADLGPALAVLSAGPAGAATIRPCSRSPGASASTSRSCFWSSCRSPWSAGASSRALALWQRWSGAYVAFAVTLFVYMLSRNLVYAAVTAVIFGTLAWVFRDRGEVVRADHARHRRGDPVHDAPELPRLAVPADAEHARPAVVVAGDARLVLPVLDRGRIRPHHPDRDVDREGVAPPAP